MQTKQILPSMIKLKSYLQIQCLKLPSEAWNLISPGNPFDNLGPTYMLVSECLPYFLVVNLGKVSSALYSKLTSCKNVN